MDMKTLKSLKNPSVLKRLLNRAIKEIKKDSQVTITPDGAIFNNTHTIHFTIKNKNTLLQGSITYLVEE